jgi:hypothetical protein
VGRHPLGTSSILLFRKYYWDDGVKENEMGRTLWQDEKCIHHFSLDHKKNNHLREQDVEGRIILK